MRQTMWAVMLATPASYSDIADDAAEGCHGCILTKAELAGGNRRALRHLLALISALQTEIRVPRETATGVWLTDNDGAPRDRHIAAAPAAWARACGDTDVPRAE